MYTAGYLRAMKEDITIHVFKRLLEACSCQHDANKNGKQDDDEVLGEDDLVQLYTPGKTEES
jgi:hypothetical protein